MSCKVIRMFYVVVARARYLARRIGYRMLVLRGAEDKDA